MESKEQSSSTATQRASHDNNKGGFMDADLPLARFRIGIEAVTPIHFYHYSGSAWRGLFGHSLKQAVCVTHERDCRQCLLYRSCAYSWIFETPPPEDTRLMRRATAAPHPFVLAPDFELRALEAGEVTSLELVLVGKGVDQLPYIVHAFERAGERGIGAARGRYRLIGLEQETAPGSGNWVPVYDEGCLTPLPAAVATPPPLPAVVTMHFESPLRLQYQGRWMDAQRFAFAGIVANLLRRYSLTSYFHDGRPVELDFKALVDQARLVEARSAALHWQDWHRYSSRQRKKVPMGGVIGSVEYDGDDVAPFWPLLWLGQWLHLGKGTSMGLGRYRIDLRAVAGSEQAA